MSTSRSDPRTRLIALPAAFAALLLLSAGVLFVFGWVGRAPTGERVTLQVVSSCPDAWAQRIDQRARTIGLGDVLLDVTGDTVRLEATLPGLPDDATAIPALLTAPGVLEIRRRGGEVVATEADLTEVYLSLDISGHPFVGLSLGAPAWERVRSLQPADVLEASLDGEVIELGEVKRVARKDELRVQPARETAAEEIREAADWHIVLGSGPGPCEVGSVGGVM